MAAFGGENKCVLEKVFGLSFDPVIKKATLHQDPCKQNKTKTSHKTCAAAMCNNRSENRPDLTYHKFSLDPETSRRWEILMRMYGRYNITYNEQSVNIILLQVVTS